MRATRHARVLIGGLGFGFTLKAALAAVAADATVVVAELLAAVIAWNSNPAFHLAADAIADPRVIVQHRDVGELIREARGSFDSIILDVDNAPIGLSMGSNDRLYSLQGLRQARAALRPAGCVAFWSAVPDAAFQRPMTHAGFKVEVERCRVHSNSGGWHTLFLGRLK